jgi:hypothetical protein
MGCCDGVQGGAAVNGIVTTLAFATAPLLIAPPASADSPGCVTRSEFRAVRNGWNLHRVHNKFDTSGRLEFASGAYKSREYRPCNNPRYSYVSVSYDHGRVYSKSAYWN